MASSGCIQLHVFQAVKLEMVLKEPHNLHLCLMDLLLGSAPHSFRRSFSYPTLDASDSDGIPMVSTGDERIKRRIGVFISIAVYSGTMESSL